jgi:hypothetical protein
VAGVHVTFIFPASSGASIANASAITNAQGIASAGAWVLGTTAGNQELMASVPAAPGVQSIYFNVTATAAAAATLTPLGSSGQLISPNGQVAQLPSVLVSDSYGNPVAGAAVTFSVSSGGGSVAGADATSGANGVATVGGWTLGSTTGNNTLTASASALASVQFYDIAVTDVTFDSIVAGGATACGLSGGIAYCWGGAPSGAAQSAVYSVYPPVPTQVAGGMSFQQIFVGAYQTFCGLTASGAFYCWGSNGGSWGAFSDFPTSVGGFLGTGQSDASLHTTIPQQIAPAQTIAGTPAPVAAYTTMYVGSDHSCAIGTDGNTYCWGSCYSGCGVSAPTASFDAPTLVTGASGFTAVAPSGFLSDADSPDDSSCGLTTTGIVECWGAGFGDAIDPTPIAPGIAVSSFSQQDTLDLLYVEMQFNACGLTAAGRVYCWGDNPSGNLGNGTSVSSTVPTRVVP